MTDLHQVALHGDGAIGSTTVTSRSSDHIDLFERIQSESE